MTELALFASTFVTVFALGLQSLNVNGGHHVAAFLTSFVIGAGNLIILKIAPHANVSEMVAYLAGGPVGIVASMHVHRRTIGRRRQAHHHIDPSSPPSTAPPPPAPFP